ncbi:phage tail assembly chaperone [Sphingomonas sp. LK11]|jgi:hypothetical protein|uniref:phage tail assembly chaperone n=1 Tax=Sphingomonas sp. LK11 TaxID=1390395 RepID=UPI0012EBC39D|nr:phage tail assembly chaperone [Sphingomonas sp. LK11]
MARVALKVEKGECDNCLNTFPGWALYKPLKSEECYEAICGACITAKAAAKAKVEPLVVSVWDSEHGKFMKAQRNLALDGSLWTVMPGTPLTIECQAKWIAYRSTLNRMTVDCSNPSDWVWPEPPALEYAEAL